MSDCPRVSWVSLRRDSHYVDSRAVDRRRSVIVYCVSSASVHTCGPGQGTVRYGHEQMFLNKSKSIFSGRERTDCETRAIQLDRFG